jgi:hypothetical protein
MTDPALIRLTRRVTALERALVLERHKCKLAERQIGGLRSAIVRLRAALLRVRADVAAARTPVDETRQPPEPPS